jgi:Putative DNA-binding domain
MGFEEEILELLETNYESSYWDFKLNWYKKGIDGNVNMIHDIICFSNNLVDRDCYIIIGVSDPNNGQAEVVGVDKDPNRRNTQQVIDLMKEIKFAGELRPDVFVRGIEIKNNILDVIVVKNSINTPYYLKEKYYGLNQNNIYTRIRDTNTPKNRSADINNVAYLWRKRFGIDKSPLEKINILIEDVFSWITFYDEDGNEGYYNKYHPEYTIKIISEYQWNQIAFYSFLMTNSSTEFSKVKIYYHNTTIYTAEYVSLDSARFFTVIPSSLFIQDNSYRTYNFHVKYYLKNSLDYKLSKLFEFIKQNEEFISAKERFNQIIILFDSNDEIEYFLNYIKENNQLITKMLHEEITKFIDSDASDNYKNNIKSCYVLKKVFDSWKNGKF